MQFKILNDETYTEECYLFGYGIMGYGVSPHIKKCADFFDDELDEIKAFLDNRDAEYEMFGKPLPREDKTAKKSKPKKSTAKKKNVKRKK